MCHSCVALFPYRMSRTHRFPKYTRALREHDAHLFRQGGKEGIRRAYPGECDVAFTARFKVAQQIWYYQKRTQKDETFPGQLLLKRKPCSAVPPAPTRQQQGHLEVTQCEWLATSLYPPPSPEPTPPASPENSPPPSPPRPVSPEYAACTQGHIRAMLWREETQARRKLAF